MGDGAILRTQETLEEALDGTCATALLYTTVLTANRSLLL